MKYYLSVEQTDFVVRRARWRAQKLGLHKELEQWIGVDQRAGDPPGGLLVLVDPSTGVEASINLWGPEGILPLDDSILVACPWGITVVDGRLTTAHAGTSHRWCNYLHSMRRSTGGLIVASTGVDAIFELSPAGVVLWQWWAIDHGLGESAFGGRRVIDKAKDHRGYKYDTGIHTTHVNSAAELGPDYVLATLFHQGMLISINRATGAWKPLLSNLTRPHAVRVLDDRHVTLADTGNGRALLIELSSGGTASIVRRVEIETRWLQDAYFDGVNWLLVDGANSRVVVADAAGTVTRIDTFDPNWRLYEAVPVNRR